MASLMQNEELKAELGDKFEELGDMVHSLKSNMKRLAEMSKNSKPLQLEMQHKTTYSKWDSLNEPDNVIENVLEDDHKQYKALQPNFDFIINGGQEAYIANI